MQDYPIPGRGHCVTKKYELSSNGGTNLQSAHRNGDYAKMPAMKYDPKTLNPFCRRSIHGNLIE